MQNLTTYKNSLKILRRIWLDKFSPFSLRVSDTLINKYYSSFYKTLSSIFQINSWIKHRTGILQQPSSCASHLRCHILIASRVHRNIVSFTIFFLFSCHEHDKKEIQSLSSPIYRVNFNSKYAPLPVPSFLLTSTDCCQINQNVLIKNTRNCLKNNFYIWLNTELLKFTTFNFLRRLSNWVVSNAQLLGSSLPIPNNITKTLKYLTSNSWRVNKSTKKSYLWAQCSFISHWTRTIAIPGC